MGVERQISVFQYDIARATDSFLTLGYLRLHDSKTQAEKQVALVNLAIGTELLIKSYLARISPALLFSDMSPEDSVALTSPQLFKGRKRSNTAFKLNFRELKTKEFADCLQLLFAAIPEIKSTLGSNLQRIGRLRNGGAHSALAAHSVYELSRTAHVVAKLHEFIGKKAGSSFWLRPADSTFLKKFNEQRSDSLRKTLETARQKYQSGDFAEHNADVSGWEAMQLECPICGCFGELLGETAIDGEQSGPGEFDQWLTFHAESFSCLACGLDLKDEEELTMAGIDSEQDRSEEIEEWGKDYGYEDYDPY